MRPFLALLKKEEMALFTSPIAYVVMSVFLVIMGYTFTLTLFLTHVPTLVHLFLQIYVLFLLTVPIITMRLVAEERGLAFPATPHAQNPAGFRLPGEPAQEAQRGAGP